MGEGPKWLAGSVVGAGLFWHRLFLTFSVGLAASLFFLFIFFLPFSSFFLFPFISFLDYLFPLLLFVVLFSWYNLFWRGSSQVVVVVVVVSQGVSSHRSAVHSEH